MATADEAIEMLNDLLGLVRTSDDPFPASTGMFLGRARELRIEADRVEAQDALIRRARKMVREHNSK